MLSLTHKALTRMIRRVLIALLAISALVLSLLIDNAASAYDDSEHGKPSATLYSESFEAADEAAD